MTIVAYLRLRHLEKLGENPAGIMRRAALERTTDGFRGWKTDRPSYGSFPMYACLLNTSREQSFDPRSKWTLVLKFFAPGTRNTFSPGWSHQPGLKVYFYSQLVAPTGSKCLLPGCGCARGWKVTFSPGWSHQPGLKVPLYIPAVSFFLPESELSRF